MISVRHGIPFLKGLTLFLGAWLLLGAAQAVCAQPREVSMTLSLYSPDFLDGHPMPRGCTCDGDDASPALRWEGVPKEAQSLALIVDDPDAPDPSAPKMTYVHWVLYNLPPSLSGLEAGFSAPPPGAREGMNDWGRQHYGGPCPPVGRHRYFHKLYALDAKLDFENPPTKPQLLKAMEGHILAEATLIGTYARPPF